MYAYRCSKAAVNMLTKGIAMDLKSKEVSVVAANPSMVTTHFLGSGENQEVLKKMGSMPVEQSVDGLLQIFDGLGMERTGQYWYVPRDGGEPAVFPAGW